MGISCAIYSQLCPVTPRGFCQFLWGGAGQGLLFAGRGEAGQPDFPRGGASIPGIYCWIFCFQNFPQQTHLNLAQLGGGFWCQINYANIVFNALFCSFDHSRSRTLGGGHRRHSSDSQVNLSEFTSSSISNSQQQKINMISIWIWLIFACEDVVDASCDLSESVKVVAVAHCFYKDERF